MTIIHFLLVNLPLFGRDVLKLDVVLNGLLSSLPYVGMLLMMSMAPVFDHVRKKKLLSVTVLRKIFTMFGMLIPAACMTSLHLLDETNVIGFLIFLTLCMTGHQLAATGGYYFSHNDLAGPFSGTLFGITNTMAQIPGFSNALLVATLTPNVGIELTRFYKLYPFFHSFFYHFLGNNGRVVGSF